MKKVLHFITGVEHGGGAENMLLQTLPYLEKTENRVCALRGRGEIGRRLEEEGVKVYYLEMKNIFDFAVIWKYRKIIREYQPEIQINYLIHADIFGRVFAKIFGVKKVISFIREKYINKLHFYLDRITLFRVDYLLANSDSTLKIYQEKLKFSKEKSSSIFNGINLDNISISKNKEEMKKELGLDVKDYIVVIVARFHQVKNHTTLISAIKKIGIPDLKLLLVGDGPLEGEIREQVEKNGLKDRILFLGKKENVFEILNISDLFILPSEREGMSNALLEAMAMKLPCIIARESGNEDLIIDKENGSHFTFGNDKDLSEKILYLYKNREVGEEMGQRGYNIVNEKYNIKKTIKKLDDFLLDI